MRTTALNVVSVEDVARGQALAYERGRAGERYLLGGEDLSLRDVFAAVAEAAGRRPPVIGLPFRPLLAAAWAADRALAPFGREPKLLVLDEVRLARIPASFSSDKAHARAGLQLAPRAPGAAGGGGGSSLKAVKLLAFSDLHTRPPPGRLLVERSAEADVVVGVGDFASVHEGLERTIDALRAIERPVVLVPGNNETDEALRAACRGWESARVLHGQGAEIDGVPFYGLGAGVPVTPWDWSFDLTDDEAAERLADCPEGGVLAVHSPPKGHLDKGFGSQAILEAIETKHPRAAVFGHIHECQGQQERAGEHAAGQPGPGRHVHRHLTGGETLSEPLSRRKFLGAAGATGAALALPRTAAAKRAPKAAQRGRGHRRRRPCRAHRGARARARGQGGLRARGSRPRRRAHAQPRHRRREDRRGGRRVRRARRRTASSRSPSRSASRASRPTTTA